jgi:hypothetical protein
MCWRRAFSHWGGCFLVLITRADGLVDTAQAAELCHVGESTIRAWVCRGFLAKAGKDERGRSLFDPVALAKAEYRTRKRARRTFASIAA